jgi:RNA polymerase sigma factor (sigma-70 family)
MRSARRDARLDMAAVDDATAKALLVTYMPVAGAFANLYPYAEREELLAAGRLAIIEAFITHKSSRANERTWVRKVLYWRIGEAAKRRPWESQHECEDSETAPNGANPEEQFWRASVLSAVGSLSPRHQTIIDARMRGEKVQEIGDSLGISHQRVTQEEQRAFKLLRGMLEDKPEPE